MKSSCVSHFIYFSKELLCLHEVQLFKYFYLKKFVFHYFYISSFFLVTFTQV